MDKIKAFLADNDLFVRHAGIELTEIKEGYAKAEMPVKEYHLNGARMVHGGAIFTLADFAFAAAANSHGRIALGIHASVDYMRAVSSGTLFAEAQELSLNHTLGNYSVRVYDDSKELVAVFHGTAYRKKPFWYDGSQAEQLRFLT